MKDVWYTCPFVPPEWIAAHGLRPRRRVLAAATSADRAAPEGACPYAHAFATAASATPNDEAVIATTLCDQMRRASEPPAAGAGDRLFVMHVPHAWQSPSAHRFYRDELQRLGRFLVHLGGMAPSKERLAEAIRACDRARRDLLAARSRLTARRFAEALAGFPEAQHPAGGTAPAQGPGAPAVAVVGGPILRGDFWIFDRIEEFGGRVVLNATVGGELTLPAPPDRRRLADDPLAELAEMYFGRIPHPARRPNSGLYEYLKREIAARDVGGILYVRNVWCDVWHAELHRLKAWAPCAVADLDLADDASAAVRGAARVQSLIETLT